MLNFLKKEANKTYTENGAVTYQSTRSDCLDLFATIGALRREGEDEIISRFLRAYTENADLAMKTLFFARDVRGGLGERRVFRTILGWLAANEPESVEKNIAYIAEYGRYDDLLTLMDTPCEAAAVKYIKEQLNADRKALKEGGGVSLLAKWLPSVNASNRHTVYTAKKIARALGMTEVQYRKTLVALRKHISILENNLREKDYTFDYSKQPSKAMFKYRKAFLRNDNERYCAFINRVAEGTEQLHTGTLMPYELVDPYLSDNWSAFDQNGRAFMRSITDEERMALNTTWESLPSFTIEENALAVIDTSGSMYFSSDPKPASVALSLGLYFAEHNTGAFKKTTSSSSLTVHS